MAVVVIVLLVVVVVVAVVVVVVVMIMMVVGHGHVAVLVAGTAARRSERIGQTGLVVQMRMRLRMIIVLMMVAVVVLVRRSVRAGQRTHRAHLAALVEEHQLFAVAVGHMPVLAHDGRIEGDAGQDERLQRATVADQLMRN